MITRKKIKEWIESRSERIARHIELRGDQDIHFAVGEMIEQCINDLSPKWVSVEDRLPEVGATVLIFTTQPLEAVMYRNNRFNRFGMDIDYATHWMPLPEPPK